MLILDIGTTLPGGKVRGKVAWWDQEFPGWRFESVGWVRLSSVALPGVPARILRARRSGP